MGDLPEPVTLQRSQWPLVQVAGTKARVTMTLVIRRAGIEGGVEFAGKLCRTVYTSDRRHFNATERHNAYIVER